MPLQNYEPTTSPLRRFEAAILKATSSTPEVARSQAFSPTGYPSKITVSPGLILHKPTRYDYAPDIDVADRKIAALGASAAAGKLAVLNVSIEPGSGKTLFLPFRFSNKSSLVVLPTVFDAWAAHVTNTAPTNLIVFDTAVDRGSLVTYTDSYHAAYLLTTGAIKRFDIVFIDESHSLEGVTNFMASVAINGIVFVRMTASPPTANSFSKKSFTVATERDVPSITAFDSAAEYVRARTEPRVMALTPSPDVAARMAHMVPGSIALTAFSPFDVLDKIYEDQSAPVKIFADVPCGKGVNLNLDCCIDFFSVSTPAGDRVITKPEQIQRRGRVGRNKFGVYCCASEATTQYLVDNYSIFRCNLWRIVNGLPTEPCSFDDVSVARAHDLLQSTIDPALVPLPSGDTQVPSPIVPVGDFVDTGVNISDSEEDDLPQVSRVQIIEDDDSIDVDDESMAPDFTTPDWVAFYTDGYNHPLSYVADMVHEHRKVTVRTLEVTPQFVVAPAANRRMIGPAPASAGQADATAGKRAVKFNQPLHVRSDPRSYVGPRDLDKARRVSHSRSNSSDDSPVRAGSASFAVATYDSAIPKTTLTRSGTLRNDSVLPLDVEHLGGPLALMRGSKSRGNTRATAYTAASVCGGYLTVAGVALASGSSVHTSLKPLKQGPRAAIRDATTDGGAVLATHCSQWITTYPLDTIDLPSVLETIKRYGAFHIPPVNRLPVIDLSGRYHPSWSAILSDRLRCRKPLPTVVPRCGWDDRSRRNRIPSTTDTVVVALDACEYPTYNRHEVQLVYQAWNILAVKSSAISFSGDHVYNDAQVLLTYMAGADLLTDL